jgi:hypothetical protein
VVPDIVDPWKLPPVKANPVNPVLAVIVVPDIVDPWKLPPVKAEPENVPKKRPEAFPVTITLVVVIAFAATMFEVA